MLTQQASRLVSYLYDPKQGARVVCFHLNSIALVCMCNADLQTAVAYLRQSPIKPKLFHF
jgi:hypothetical protein